MATYREHISELAELEEFDPKAFRADARFSQQLCDFVLSLALVFNDLKDVVLGMDVLRTVAPANKSAVTAAVGEYNGLVLHLFRTALGIVHELTELVKNNNSVLTDREFAELRRKLSPGARDAWDAVAAAVDKSGPRNDQLGKFIFHARNKVVYHYDRKEIARGYARAFSVTGLRQPFVSRGNTLRTSRFHFADAAAEDYLRDVGGRTTDEVFSVGSSELIQHVTFSVHEVVITFIAARGCGWRTPTA